MTGIRYIAQSTVVPLIAALVGTIAYAAFLWPGLLLALAITFGVVMHEWGQAKRADEVRESVEAERSVSNLSTDQVAELLHAVASAHDGDGDGNGDNGNGSPVGVIGHGRHRRIV